MKCLYVLFDADCELCVRCRNWLAQQPAFMSLVFVAFQSGGAQRRFPGIGTLEPAEHLLAISDQGAVYRGAHAWITCIWALQKYRQHARAPGASSVVTVRKNRLRIALTQSLLLIARGVPTGTTPSGTEPFCSVSVA
jgi:hypothetical protein